MRTGILDELYAGLDEGSGARYEYTRRAYGMLTGLDKPRLLDVGCGRGGVTLELAQLTAGEVVAIDVDASSLETLRGRVRQEGLADRVQAVRGSMRAMEFAAESFDVIWAEGSIHVMGVEPALKAWRRLVRSGGYVVVHEMAWLKTGAPPEIVAYWREVFGGIQTVDQYAEAAKRCGYNVVGHFLLSKDFWGREYYGSLARRIEIVKHKYAGKAGLQDVLAEPQREVELYSMYNQWYGSAFLVLQWKAK